MDELLKNISVNDIEKLRALFSIAQGNERMDKQYEGKATPQEIVTLRVFIDEYLYLIKNNRSASYHESVQLSVNHLTSFFDSQKSIRSIQMKDIENFIVHLQQKVKKGYVVYFRNLKAAFNKARDWGYVTENYFTKVKLPKKQKLVPVFINSNQLSAITNYINNEVVKDVVVFAFYTGMRLDEIVNLRWKNVDLHNGVIIVGDEKFTTKGRNQRFIPMCDEIVEMLGRRKKQEAKKAIENVELRIVNERQKENKKIHLINDPSASLRVTNRYVFCKRDGVRYTDDHYSKGFKKACKAAGMDSSIHFHSLRHSFASNLVQKGVPLYTIKELLGHSSISTTEIYSHLNMDTLREAIEKLGSRYEGQGTRKEATHFIPPAKCEGQALPRVENELKIFSINSGEKR